MRAFAVGRFYHKGRYCCPFTEAHGCVPGVMYDARKCGKFIDGFIEIFDRKARNKINLREANTRLLPDDLAKEAWEETMEQDWDDEVMEIAEEVHEELWG